MLDLKDHLETLQDLNETRDRAKDLRERGLRSLRRIKNTRTKDELGNPINKVLPVSKEGSDLTIEERERLDDDEEFFKNWICSGNEAEVALLVKVQNHQNLSEYEETNDHAEAHPELIGRLKNIDLKTLFPSPYTQDVDSTVPVLVAARAMQALTARPETVFSKASMYCYYRVIRELYYAAAPDWTIGAARAGRGGRTSAFITSECIRAILAFESAIRRTSEYFVSTRALYKRYLHLEAMLTNVGIAPDSEHTLSKWADKEIERMWLDWYISTNPRNGAIALYCETPNDIFPFPPKLIEPPVINMKSVREAFLTLKDRISQAMDIVYDNICEARGEIIDFRVKEFENIADGIDSKSRTESAHLRASKIINHALLTAIMVKQDRHTELEYSDLQKLFDYLIKEYEDLPDKIHQVLEPAKRYVHTVLDRELAIAYSGKTFDAGELVFAAMAFGAATHWRENDKLKQACDALVKALPDNGKLVTSRPFHATQRGYKLLPIGCEMTRALAKLLHRTRYNFEPTLAQKMLGIFLSEKQTFHLRYGEDNKKQVGWNFEHAPGDNKPYVWVTAIAVQALDRMVRMLNDRINEIVFKHFKVIRPETPHTDLTLNELIYPDYGLSERYGKNIEDSAKKTSIAIRLEQMRAHVMRASLPKKYKKDADGNNERVSSAILYGPPGTGKTTLLEALAVSSKAPLVMLSPSDIIVQGQEQLEGRAKAVFDALSMLSQVVIILDEFEPILRRRTPKLSKDVTHGFGGMRKGTREDGASMLKFLLTGMLPKLIRLHDASEKQSLVYCLATNHLEEIDDAAKRGGRFDVHQPIFNPDPLSRAGTFLFRLQEVAKDMNERIDLFDISRFHIFTRIIAATANENGGELSRRFFKVPRLEKINNRSADLSSDDVRRSFFAHALRKGIDTEAFEKRINHMEAKNFEKMKREFEEAKRHLDDDADEKVERDWLLGYEDHIRQPIKPNSILDSLDEFLRYEGKKT